MYCVSVSLASVGGGVGVVAVLMIVYVVSWSVMGGEMMPAMTGSVIVVIVVSMHICVWWIGSVRVGCVMVV